MSFGRLGSLGRGIGRLGSGGAAGAFIVLSDQAIAEDASVGDLVGTLSVSNGSGTYAFTITLNDYFELDGVDDTRVEVKAALTHGLYNLAFQADNGVDPVVERTIQVTVTLAAPTLTWVTGATDSTPTWTIGPDGAAFVSGDVVTVSVFTDAGKTTLEDTGTYTFNGVSFDTTEAVGPLADGAKWAHAVLSATGFADSALSNTETKTIDATAPTISGALSPADNAVDVAITANCVITFSENVQGGAAASFRLYETTGDVLVQTFTQADFGGAVTIADAAVTINWTANLTNSTAYYIQIDAGSIEDLAGNAFAGIADETTWNFTTVAAVGGTVFDNAAIAHNKTTGSNTSFTVGSGSNRALVVGVVQTNGTVNTPSGVTYNGVAMTAIGGQLWGLVAPASGANNIVPTFTGGGECSVVAMSVEGADQTGGATTFAGYATDTNTSALPTITVASAVGDICFAVFICATQLFTTAQDGTDIGNNSSPTSGVNGSAGLRNDGAASVTLSYNMSVSDFWISDGVSIVAA